MADGALALDAMDEAEAREALTRCCGARAWVEAMLAGRPYGSSAALHARADAVWAAQGEASALEAFHHHPRIGASLAELRTRYGTTASLSAAEQAGAADASDGILARLADGNRAYEARFGFVFLVCATGKRADEMLALLETRLTHTRAAELAIARAEQAKIMHLRLEKLA